MWSCYADGGVCIEFEKDDLDNRRKHISVVLGNIIYDEKSEFGIAAFNPVSYLEQNEIRSYIELLCIDAQDIVSPFKGLFSKTAFIKNKFEESEKEWRISIPYSYQKQRINNDYDVQNHNIVDMSFDGDEKYLIHSKCNIPFKPGMIYSITLAPNCHATVNDIEKLLFTHGFDDLAMSCMIKRSKGSLR